MDHVLSLEREVDGSTERQVQLVCRDDPVLWVAELPPPLMSDHLDLQCIRPRLSLRLEDRPDRRNGDDDQNQERDDRPGDFKGSVAVDMLRRRLPRTSP